MDDYSPHRPHKSASQRALSAFMYFSRCTREIVKREMPELEFLQVSSEVGRRWKQTTDAERQKYAELDAADKQRYVEEKAAYDNVPPPVYTPAQKTKKTKVPRRAISSYLFFCDDIRKRVRAEHPTKTIPELATLYAEMWRGLPEDTRAKYLTMRDEFRHLKAKEVYVPVPSFESTESPRKRKDPNAPKRALSAYFFFCNEIRESVRAENPNKKITEIATLLAAEWRAMPDKKRVKYQKMHEEAKVKYQSAM